MFEQRTGRTTDELEHPNNLELLYNPDLEHSIIASTTVDEGTLAALWPILETGFIDLNRKSYEKQDMSYAEFVEDMGSDEVYKYVAYDKERTPMGYMTVHAGMNSVPWVDSGMVLEKQAEKDPGVMPYYVGTLVVPKEMRGMGIANDLLRGALLHLKQVNEAKSQNALAFFDCADANHPWLAKLISDTIKQHESVDRLKIAIDHFHEEAWVKDSEGRVAKVPTSLETNSKVIDKQHYYSVEVS